MKVFISWSGPKSRAIAEQLYKWLPYIIQPLKPFLSNGIRKGARWGDVLAHELEQTKYGILCITRQNIVSPWLNFEAGALSKLTGQARVAPVLFGIDPSTLTGPLSQFQATTVFNENNKEEILGLLCSINDTLPEEQRVPPYILRATFDNCWHKFSADIGRAMKTPTKETATGLGWLYSVEDLISEESEGDWREVWVITPEPLKDWYLLRETVRANVARGIDYHFIVSSLQVNVFKELIQSEVLRPSGAVPPAAGGAKVYMSKISWEKYKRMAATHYRILFSKGNKGPDKKIFFEIPSGRSGDWAEAGGAAVENFYIRFKNMKEKVPREECISCQQPSEENAPEPHRVAENEHVGGDIIPAQSYEA